MKKFYVFLINYLMPMEMHYEIGNNDSLFKYQTCFLCIFSTLNKNLFLYH